MPVAVNLQMPQLDEEMEEGHVVRWLKAAGDPIDRGEVIVEIETDKAIVDLESPVSGALGSIHIPAGREAPVGATLGVIYADESEMEDQPDDVAPPTAEDEEHSEVLSPMRRPHCCPHVAQHERGPPLLRHHRDRHDPRHRLPP